MKRIVGVHGVRNYRAGIAPDDVAAQLKSSWTAALTKSMGDKPFDLSVAYYAHLLRRRAHGPDTDPDTLDDEALEMLTAWDEDLRGPVGAAHGRATRPARNIIGRMSGSPWSGLPVQVFVLLWLRDVQRYLGRRNEQRRIAARDAVSDEIRRRRATVVLGHSLGSVVAYEALCAHQDLPVDLFITVGSPLALRGVVLNRLTPQPVEIRRPPNVARWVNIADPGDLCAIPPRLGRVFDVDDDVEAPVDTFAFHDVELYLACDATGKAVRGTAPASTGPRPSGRPSRPWRPRPS